MTAGATQRHQRFLTRAGGNGWLFVLPTVATLLLLGIYPMLNAIWESVRTENLFNPSAAHYTGLSNYAELLGDSTFRRSLLLTAIWTGVVVTAEVVLGFALALLLHRRMRGIGILRTLIVIPVFVSPVAMGLVWRFIFEPTSGLANWLLHLVHLPGSLWLSSTRTSLASVMITDIWQWTPFMALILAAGLDSISPEILEAASLDRLRGLTYLTRVLIPLIWPVLMVALFIRLVDAIRVFDLIYIMTRGGPGSSSLVGSVYAFSIFQGGDLGQTAAFGILLLIIVNLVVTVFIRYLWRQERQMHAHQAAP